MLLTVERVLFLRMVDMFASIDEDVLVSLAGEMKEREFRAGEPIMREGEIGRELYVVVAGRVRIHKTERIDPNAPTMSGKNVLVVPPAASAGSPPPTAAAQPEPPKPVPAPPPGKPGKGGARRRRKMEARAAAAGAAGGATGGFGFRSAAIPAQPAPKPATPQPPLPGREKEIAILGSKGVFGELAALDPQPRTASVTALEETRVLELDHTVLFEELSGNTELARGIIRFLVRRFRELREKK